MVFIIPNAKNQVSNHSGIFRPSFPRSNKIQSITFVIYQIEGTSPIINKKRVVLKFDVEILRK